MPDRDNRSVVFLHPPEHGDALKALHRELAHGGIAMGDTDINPNEIAGELLRRLA